MPDPRDVADRRPNLVEPDFTIVNLPTTLRLPRYKSAFWISHRFARTLNDPAFGRLAGDLFGLDTGALMGLQYRFASCVDYRPASTEPPRNIIHLNTYGTAGCLGHIEHGHDIPGCADVASGIESNTLIAALSRRLRVMQTVYLVGSWTPRASGFRPGVSLKTFGLEKRLRGHVFQLNVSNGLGTKVAEMARGATNDRDWFLGFNISRKFY